MSRHQGKRGSQRDFEQFVMAGERCPAPCGKVRFLTKGDAKKKIRRMRGRKGRLHAYPCGDFWHTGHVPTVLKRGEVARADVEARRVAQ